MVGIKSKMIMNPQKRGFITKRNVCRRVHGTYIPQALTAKTLGPVDSIAK